MKTKWAVLAGFAAIVLAVAIGCDTDGGSTYGAGSGTTNKPVVVQIRFGLPVCSTSSEGSVNGAVFNGGAGYVYVAPGCADPTASMYVWMKVLTSVQASAIDHYVWTIRNWSAAAPNGIFTTDTYDSVIESNTVFKVRTSVNQIRYMSTALGNLPPSVYNQMIDVSVVTKDGQVASGYISLFLYDGQVGGAPVIFGSLTSLDQLSQARPGSRADYFTTRGTGASDVIDLEGDFDTFLVLYDANLNALASNDDVIPGLDVNSRIQAFLTNGATYFLEATSFSNNVTGNYSLSISNGILTNVPSPFEASGSCDSIAATYALTEILEISLTFNGQTHLSTNVVNTTSTITQTDCDFMYPLVDPTGVIPPVVRMGRVNFATLSLYNEAYMPQTPELFITANTLSGSGQAFASGLEIDSSGSVRGVYLGIPFQIDYVSKASFSK